ncbi:MAG: phosphate transport system protein [Cryomorphaceae bacterium]|jgi:phosphate transport system protein
MHTREHILTEFDDALNQLKSNTISIATLTQKNVENAFSGLTQRDLTICNQVIADDEEVDQLEIQIDNDSLQVMAKFQPFASDLRLVVASMKITHNLERISDHAVSIAKRSRKIIKSEELEETSFIEPVYQQALLMLKTAIHSYSENSTDKALEVLSMDDDLNKFQKSATKAFTKKLEEPCDNYKTFLNLVFITRWIERIGDLSTNIAEDVIFMESAQDIRHGGELEE